MIQIIYGLIGYPLTYSGSPGIFKEIFTREGIQNAAYKLFPLKELHAFYSLLSKYPNLKGLNITTPYKEKIIELLDHVDPVAMDIGAVNCVKIQRGSDRCITNGYNTDHIAFLESLLPHLQKHHRQALVLGTGGASRAVTYALKNLDIKWRCVSRHPGKGQIGYQDLIDLDMNEFQIVVNATSRGMVPDNSPFPEMPYHKLNERHLLYDLVYHPAMTFFLKSGAKQSATLINGMKMLQLQAEKSWKLWQVPDG
jgi:shikimate dehydrogenase